MVDKLEIADVLALGRVLESFRIAGMVDSMTATLPQSGVKVTVDDSGVTFGESSRTWLVRIDNVGGRKIQVIKAVRQATNLGLKEAKDVVDFASTTPISVFDPLRNNAPIRFTEVEAAKLSSDLYAAGATATVL